MMSAPSNGLAPGKSRIPGMPVADAFFSEAPAQVNRFAVARRSEVHQTRIRVAHHYAQCLDLPDQLVKSSLGSRIAGGGRGGPV